MNISQNKLLFDAAFLSVATFLVLGIVLATTQGTSSPPTTQAPQTESGSYSSTDIAQHSNQDSCWTVVNSTVYDVTSWINQHPGGGQAILMMCGKDATSLFAGQHGGQPGPEAELASFKIGTLQ